MNFKVFAGCPGLLGFKPSPSAVPRDLDNIVRIKSNTSMEGAIAMAQSVTTNITLPAMSGPHATVGVFFGSVPGKYAVVDFSKGSNQTVKFGYGEVSNRTEQHIVDNDGPEGQNRAVERRVCPGSG